MSTCFGVSLGSSSACVAVSKDGKSEVIANEFGERATPMYVCYQAEEKLIGRPAKHSLHRCADVCVTGMPCLVGAKMSDQCVQAMSHDLGCELCEGVEGEVCYVLRGGKVTAQQALTDALGKVKESCLSLSSDGSARAVFAVPTNFSACQKNAVRAAATEAGFTVLRVISESAAVCLAYDIGQTQASESYVLHFAVGKHTSAATVLSATRGLYRVLGWHAAQGVGGAQIDQAVVGLLVEEFARRWGEGVRESGRALGKMATAAEEAKQTLSTNQQASVHIDSLHREKDFQYTLTRGRLEGLCSALVRRAVASTAKALEAAGISRTKLTHVVLSGGSCRVPLVQAVVRQAFPSCPVLCSLPPEEGVALGAALEAELLASPHPFPHQPPHTHTHKMPCSSADLWIVCPGVAPVMLLPAHTPVPCKRTVGLQSIQCDQEEVCVEVMEGGEDGGTRVTVAKFFVPHSSFNESLQVNIHWTSSGVVTVLVRDGASGWSSNVELTTHTPLHTQPVE